MKMPSLVWEAFVLYLHIKQQGQGDGPVHALNREGEVAWMKKYATQDVETSAIVWYLPIHARHESLPPYYFIYRSYLIQ